MRRAAALLATLAACGTDTSRVLVELVEPARCEEYCVTSIDVTVGTQLYADRPCGEPIALDAIEVGKAVPIALVVHTEAGDLGAAGELRGVAGDRIAIDLTLAPVAPPSVTGISSPRAILFGSVELTIDGAGFGPSGFGTVTVGGQPATVRSWADDEIVAVTEVPGDVVVSRCGISAAPRPSNLVPLDIEVLTPLLASCASGRFVSATTPNAGPSLGLFDCGADACGPALVAELEGDVFGASWGLSGCPRRISAIDERPWLLVDDAISECALPAGAGAAACELKAPAPVVLMSATAASGVVFTRPGAAPGTDPIYLLNEGGLSRIAPDRPDQPLALERRLVLTRTATTVRLLSWRGTAGHELEADIALANCEAGRLLLSNGTRRLIVAVCVSGDSSSVRFFDLMERPNEVRAALQIRGFVADAAALTVDGGMLLLWSRGVPGGEGGLAWVRVSDASLVGRRKVPGSYAGAALGRVAQRDEFYLGGPERGQLTRVRVPAP